MLLWVRLQARGISVRIDAKIATICEKTFARPYLSNDRDIVAKTRRSTLEMSANVDAGSGAAGGDVFLVGLAIMATEL